MDWLGSIIKAEHSSYELASLWAILAEHGEIAAFLPCELDHYPKQCFVRYSSSQGAENAYNNQKLYKGLQVLTLSQDPSLLGQYIALHSTLNSVRDRPEEGNILASDDRLPSAPGRCAYTQTEAGKTRSSEPLTPRAERQDGLHHVTVRRPSNGPKARIRPAPSKGLVPWVSVPPSFDRKMQPKREQPNGLYSSKSSLFEAPKLQSKEEASKRHSTSKLCASPIRAASKLSVLGSPYSPVHTKHSEGHSRCASLGAPRDTTCVVSQSPTIAAPTSFCMATKIELTVAGTQFVYDLKKLEDDPKSIIELLKLASAERGHWMIVAAYYRRSGNARAAINLMAELIEVLKRHNVQEDKMKPAYLMLSGCEADLAKGTKGSAVDPQDASVHYQKSQTWLQKVYGAFECATSGEVINSGLQKPAPDDLRSKTSSPRSSCAVRPPNNGPEKRPIKRPRDVIEPKHGIGNKRRKHYSYYRRR